LYIVLIKGVFGNFLCASYCVAGSNPTGGNDILFMKKTYRPSSFSVLLQLKDLISKNMKISK